VVLCAAQPRGGRPCSGEPLTAPTCVGRRDGAVIPRGLHKPKSSPALSALPTELQESLHTFRAADLLIERSTVQQPPINLEVRYAPPAAPLASLLLLCCFLGQPTRCSSDAAPHSTSWHARSPLCCRDRRPALQLSLPPLNLRCCRLLCGARQGGPAACLPAALCPAAPRSSHGTALCCTTLPQDLKFGTVFTDHMLHIEHSVTEGWTRPTVKPFGLLQMHPASQVGAVS
jgi:hypothetical protein